MNDFPHPLNQVIEEEIEIPSIEPVLNIKEKRIELKQTTKKATRKTIYSDAKPQTVICSEHIYFCVDKGKYRFICKSCDWVRILVPIDYKFDEKTGIATYRKSGIRV